MTGSEESDAQGRDMDLNARGPWRPPQQGGSDGDDMQAAVSHRAVSPPTARRRGADAGPSIAPAFTSCVVGHAQTCRTSACQWL